MDISLHWLNKYLAPGDVTADEADEALTHAGFPIEARETLEGGDVRLDVEVTSNRGDVLSHLGCAREIAASGVAAKPRDLMPPAVNDPPAGPPVEKVFTLENREPAVCPLFTARVIQNVKVGPSPDWLVRALESVGQRSINNVVDVTNFITFELGNPCHVFDLNKLDGAKLVIRYASDGETLTTLDDKPRKLVKTDLVVADATRPQSLAGVMGGADSDVDENTTDVVFEMATWDPVTIRTTARRLGVRTDAGYRFERGVDPRTIEDAARRAAALVCELTGGILCEGVLAEGAPMPEDTVITLRPSRCERLIGIPIPVGDMIERLRALEIGVEQEGGDELACTIPPWRLDLTREVDLVEEVARTRGLDAVPIHERVQAAVAPPQEDERAMREVAGLLTGLGFYETVTFSFVSPDAAKEFLGDGLALVEVDDERRKAEPTLRPSVVPSLLACRRANQDAQASPPGGVRLFETSAVFAQTKGGESRERRTLTLLADVPGQGAKRSASDTQDGVRQLRGAVEAIARATFGPGARVALEPAKPGCPGWDADAFARVTIDGADVGSLGLVSGKSQSNAGIDLPVLACELDLDPLLDAYPPRASAHALPAFPPIERDLSLVVPESLPWASVESLVGGADLERLEGCSFVGTYRGKQVGEGKKSLTLRLRFRDPGRTLRHEEVDPQVEALVAAATRELGAEVRS